jgi:hypothetical protein
MSDVENMVCVFEKAFGNYNLILRKVLVEKICRYYDNRYDLPAIANMVFDNYSGKWGKPPDWPEIKTMIQENEHLFKTSCTVCRQYLSQYEKKHGTCNYCERQRVRALEPPLTEAERKEFDLELAKWRERIGFKSYE